MYLADLQGKQNLDGGPARNIARLGGAVVGKAPRGFTLTFFDALEMIMLLISLIKYRAKYSGPIARRGKKPSRYTGDGRSSAG